MQVIPPENVKKPLVFWRFLGGTEMEHEKIGQKDQDKF